MQCAINMKNYIEKLILRLPELNTCKSEIAAAYGILEAGFGNGGKLLVCGNGGSSADSAHIVGELMKGFLLKRPTGAAEGVLSHLQRGLPAIDLTAQSGLISAFANDTDAGYVYAQQVYAYANGCPADVLLALSTSGNSANVVHAAEAAKAAGIRSVAITGKKESKLSGLCDVCIRLPSDETYRIQEYTMPVYHCLCAALEETFFGR